MSTTNISKVILFGVAVGDALGVPVEFQYRQPISINPVKDMIGNYTHNQTKGTWFEDICINLKNT